MSGLCRVKIVLLCEGEITSTPRFILPMKIDESSQPHIPLVREIKQQLKINAHCIMHDVIFCSSSIFPDKCTQWKLRTLNCNFSFQKKKNKVPVMNHEMTLKRKLVARVQPYLVIDMITIKKTKTLRKCKWVTSR